MKLSLILFPLLLYGQASTVNYATIYGSSDAAPIQPFVMNYLSNNRFDHFILTYPTVPAGQFSKSYNYSEGTCTPPWDSQLPNGSAYYTMRDAVVIPNGWNLESMFMHHSVDFEYTSANINGNTQFDWFDVNLAGTKINGVLNYNGSTYTDVTATSFTGGAITVTNTLYVGFMLPFDQVNFTITTGQVGGTVTYNYWNGSWTAIPSLTDGTTALLSSGKISWSPPSDWAMTTVNSSKNKYWLQIVIGGTPATNVKYSKILGDDITVSSAGTNTRGWDWTNADGTHINIGTPLEYDPTPPANATAKFAYQGRLFCNGQTLYAYHNDSYIPSGTTRAWASWLAYKAENNPCVLAGTCGGFMFDDTALIPLNSTVTNPANSMITYLDYNQGSTLIAERAAMIPQAVSLLHTALGANFKVGGNNDNTNIYQLFDFNYEESTRYTIFQLGGIGVNDIYKCPDPQSFGYATFDCLLTANNPAGTIGYMMLYDLTTSSINPNIFGGGSPANWHQWDRGNRAPITALAGYYLGANSNTGFVYYNNGGSYQYSDTDQAYVYQTPTTLAASIGPLVAGSNTVQLISTAGCTAGSSNAIIVIGGTVPNGGESITGTISGNNINTSLAINNTHTIGDTVYCVAAARQSQSVHNIPVANVWKWGQWFPARTVNIGIPDAAGLNAGARIQPWKYGGSPDNIDLVPSCSTKCTGLYRRDFTKAIVLLREYIYTMNELEWDTPSAQVCINGTYPSCTGGPYYPLLADGTTGPGITYVQLRSGEGVILMKTPTKVYNPQTDHPMGNVGVSMAAGGIH